MYSAILGGCQSPQPLLKAHIFPATAFCPPPPQPIITTSVAISAREHKPPFLRTDSQVEMANLLRLSPRQKAGDTSISSKVHYLIELIHRDVYEIQQL